MPFLPSVIKRVDEFFKIAERYSLVSLGADDQALQAELAKASKEVINPEVSYNLVALAAMYQKALEINGGFNTIYKAIQAMVEDMDPEEEETEPVEDLLNQIAKSIKARASRPDSPGDMRELQMAATAARATEESPFNYDEPEEGDEPSAYEAMLGYGGAEKAFEEAGGVSQFDMTGGVSTEAAQGGTGRGYSVGKARTFKDWAAFYANEAAKYNSDLNDPSNMLSPSARYARNDTRVQSNLKDLTKVLDELSKLTIRAIQIQNQIDIETEIQHPKEEAELTEIRKRLGELEQKRRLLKRSLNTLYKKIELDNLKSKVNEPGISSQERRILEQKIKLQDLRTRGAYGYGQEAKARAKLIAALTADPNLSPEQFNKMNEAINGAAQFTDRMTKAQYDRKVTEDRGKEQKRLDTPSYEATRGGARVPMERLPQDQQIDLEAASFSALVYQFQIDIASATQPAKQAIYRAESGGGGSRKQKAKENPEYKKIIDEISDAIRKKDRMALYAAQNKLLAAVNGDMHVAKNQLKGFVDVLKLEPHFRKVLEAIKDVTKNEKATKQNPNPAPPKLDDSGDLIEANLTEQDRETLTYILNDIHRLRMLYTTYYTDIAGMTARREDKPSTEWWQIKKLVTPRFKKVIEDMGRIEVYLNLKAHVRRPETTQKYPERSLMLQDILKQDKKMSSNHRMLLLKLAQDATAEQEVDEATADRLANEFFDKVYDEALQRMFSELQA